MPDSHHRLNRFQAVHKVTEGLAANQPEAQDALRAIAHEFSVYEVETAELYAFGDRVREIIAEVVPSHGRLHRIASDLDALDARIDQQIRRLTGRSRSREAASDEPVTAAAGDWPIG